MACVDLARKLWKENTEELKASKAKLPQVGELLAKYDLKLKTLVGAVAAKYLTKDSAENLLKDLVRGVTKGADTELGWSTELEEANRSLDEAIGYLDLDYPDAADKVRQNRRSRPKGVEEKGKGKGKSDRDRTRTPAREPATSLRMPTGNWLKPKCPRANGNTSKGTSHIAC